MALSPAPKSATNSSIRALAKPARIDLTVQTEEGDEEHAWLQSYSVDVVRDERLARAMACLTEYVNGPDEDEDAASHSTHNKIRKCQKVHPARSGTTKGHAGR